MKKRILIILLAMLLAFAVINVAMAEEESCTHEYTTTYVEWDDYDNLESHSLNKTTHTVIGSGTVHVECENCGTVISVEHQDRVEMEEPHSFVDGTCSMCGYTCEHLNQWNDTVWDWDSGNVVYRSIDDRYHEVSGPGYTYTYCPDCNCTFNEVHSDNLKATYWHSYNEEGVCEDCQHKNTCAHAHTYTSISWGDDISFTVLDSKYHEVKGTGYEYTYCNDCGQLISKSEELTERTEKEWHDYDSNGVCYQCGYENTCEHKHQWTYWSWSSIESYAPKDDKLHTVTGTAYTVTYCEDCGEKLARGAEETKTQDEGHSYDDEGICTQCGHKNTCAHENTRTYIDFRDWNSVTYTPVDGRNHLVTGDADRVTYCTNCREVLSREDVGEASEEYEHEYVDGVCRDCGYENHCEHENAYEDWTFLDWDDVKYVKKDGKYHTATGLGYTYTYCPDCGQELNRGGAETLVKVMWHEYNSKGVCTRCGYKSACKHPHAYQNTGFYDWDTVEITYTPNAHIYSGGAGFTYMYCPDCGKDWDYKEVDHAVYSEAHHFRVRYTLNEDIEPEVADLDEVYHTFTGPGSEGLICIYCGYEKGERTEKDKVVVKRAHTYDDDGICTVCGHKKATGKVIITAQPSNAYVVSGEKATFTVKASGKKLTYQWYYRTNEAAKWKAIKTGTKASYSVTGKPKNDGYQYRCVVKGTGGSATTIHVTLTVESHPPVILAGPESVEILSGEKATFAVNVDGIGLSYQWYSRTSDQGSWKAIEKGTKASYSVTAKYASNGYQYRCVIKNADGKVVSENATLTVIPQPPEIIGEPADQTVKLTEKAVFQVEATRAASYQWYYRTSESAKWTKITKGTKASYSVTPSVKNNGYQYKCVVKNADGKVETRVATLTLDAVIPVITLQPKKVTAKKDAQVTFSVEAENAETFQWYYRKSASAKWTKIKGATEPTYTFKATSKKNGYQYKCDVSSVDCTVASKAVTLKVK